jgi:signal transduction histidine kinase
VSARSARFRWTWWPRSLFGRIALVLFCGLAAAHILTLTLLLRERSETMGAMMMAYLAKDVASSVAILDRLPAAERPSWLPKIERRNYRYILGNPSPGRPADSPDAREISGVISRALDGPHDISISMSPGASDPLQLAIHLKLKDGAPLTIELMPPTLMVSGWVITALALQLVLLGLFTWLAVRIATRPLARLAQAADDLRADRQGPPLPEDGPTEVGRAAAAFNAMQRRIADHLAERIRILAAISHDLQSPIARMRLRADLLDDTELKHRFQRDLTAMQTLVAEGLELARSMNGQAEAAVATDLQALIESLVYDYVDAGQKVRLIGRLEAPLITRPQTLRRVVTNLVDNALKFAGDAELSIARSDNQVAIIVRDHGPGIPDRELETVLQPFYRVEGSRNRETGGTGLGLAIVQQLTAALNGQLLLLNLPSGGLEARLLISAVDSDMLLGKPSGCRIS